jgi:hypothetical protein
VDSIIMEIVGPPVETELFIAAVDAQQPQIRHTFGCNL